MKSNENSYVMFCYISTKKFCIQKLLEESYLNTAHFYNIIIFTNPTLLFTYIHCILAKIPKGNAILKTETLKTIHIQKHDVFTTNSIQVYKIA